MGSRLLPSSAFLRAVLFALSAALCILPGLVLARHAGITRHYKFNVSCIAFHWKHVEYLKRAKFIYIAQMYLLIFLSWLSGSCLIFSIFCRSNYKMWPDSAKQKALSLLTGSSRGLGSSQGKATASWSKWLTMSSTMSPSIGTRRLPRSNSYLLT